MKLCCRVDKLLIRVCTGVFLVNDKMVRKQDRVICSERASQPVLGGRASPGFLTHFSYHTTGLVSTAWNAYGLLIKLAGSVLRAEN